MDTASPMPDPKAEIEAVLGLKKGRTASFLVRWRGRLIVAVLVVAAAAGYAIWGVGGADDGYRYAMENAEVSNITVTVTATGSVQPTNRVDVSSELSGIVRKVMVDFNAEVKEGQPLAELDTDKLKATVESSRAKLAAANARVTEARATIVEKKLDFDRKKALVARKVTATRDLELARAAYDRALAALASARADVDAAKADLKLQEANLAKACICSPITGVVLSRNVEPGQTVASSFQAPILFSLAEDLRKMEVQVDVDEADIGKVHQGQKATFTVDAYPDRKFDATIRELRLGSEIIQGVVTYKAILSADNSDLLLRPGMTATAEITVRKVDSVLTVPNAALRFSPPATTATRDNRNFLMRLLPGRPRFRRPSKQAASGTRRTLWVLRDGQPAPIRVAIGATDGKRTQIVNGKVEAGQQVIVDATRARK